MNILNLSFLKIKKERFIAVNSKIDLFLKKKAKYFENSKWSEGFKYSLNFYVSQILSETISFPFF